MAPQVDQVQQLAAWAYRELKSILKGSWSKYSLNIFCTKNINAYPSLLHLLGNSSLNIRQKLYPIVVVVAHQQLVVYIG